MREKKRNPMAKPEGIIRQKKGRKTTLQYFIFGKS